ncbi:MAG: class I SAM-dependent methyltransferase [Saprospiraceae bacterium]|nr:class I SAM-dependent methyltransferase [Saprospiraceae bacterium]
MKDYKAINKKLWNDLTEVHLGSKFYDVDSFRKGKSSLKHVELDLLGDVNGLDILHLQCHFGMDSISLARMGAHVTGVDLSDRAIDAARKLAKECDVNAQFINCDVYELINVHQGQYDIVFSTYGTIGWLPDMDQWAEVVHSFLKPSGKLILVEFHPVIWMMSYDFQKIEYGYFNTGAIEEITEGSYVDDKAPIKNPSISWNHPFSEVVTSLINKNMQISHLSEYDYSVYDCFENTVEIAPDRYQIKGLEGLLPMMYAITALK